MTRELLTLKREVGFRVMLHWQTLPRDLRWFRGLRWHR